MEFNFISRALFFIILLASVLSSFSSTSSFISDGVFEFQTSVTGRNLLQTKKACPVDFEFKNYTIITSQCKACNESFEFKNYTIITSQCKGPKYPPKECCAAFKDFACPYRDDFNDLSTDCSTTMFTYINRYGKYPPGLFANLCQEGKEGLECPADPPTTPADANAATTASSRLWLIVSAAFLVLLTLFWSWKVIFLQCTCNNLRK